MRHVTFRFADFIGKAADTLRRTVGLFPSLVAWVLGKGSVNIAADSPFSN